MSATIESIVIPAKRGPKAPHAGQFKKGFDARRAPPIKRNLMEACAEAAQESAPRAIAFLNEVMEDSNEVVKVRLIAAKEILDRSIGQSVSMSVHRDLTDPSGGAVGRNSQLSSFPPADLSDKQLLEVIQGELSHDQEHQEAAATAPPGELVEAEFREVSDPPEPAPVRRRRRRVRR